MPEIRVTDEQGTVHVFPEGSTPDMIAKAMNVRPPAAAGPQFAAPPEGSTAGKVARGAALGAFEGAGIVPATTPLGVLRDTAKQLASGVTGFVGETWRRNQGSASTTPLERGVATALDLVPAFIDRTATALESGGREAIAAGKQGDYEQAAEKAASTLTSAALLRSPAKAEEGLGAAGKLRLSVRDRFQPIARKVTGVEPAVKEAVTKAAEKQGTAIAQHVDTAENVAQRGELAKTADTKSQALGKQLEKVEASVGKEANQKFEAVRGKLGISEGNPGPEVPPDQLVATVRDIEQNVLQGIPENVKEFRSILGHGEEAEPGMRESFTQATGKEPLGGEPFTWDKLQSLKSRLDTRLRQSRGMNGDLKRGLYQARDAVVNTMGEIAEPAGAGESWADAKNFYRQYKEDFHEPTGPSGSGSPVAQALDAVDPKNIRQPFLRTQSAIGNRGTEILRKYPQHGGNEAATLAEEVVGHNQALQDMPNRPKGFSPDKPPAAPTVNVNQVAREAIAAKAKNWGMYNARDIGILTSGFLGGFLEHLFRGGGVELPIAVSTYEGGKYVASRALNNPKVINWLAKTPPEEIAAIQKIPGADKVRIVDVLTRTAMDAAKDGKLPVLSPEVRRLLGPANLARIAAVTGATQPKTPGEAKERLRSASPATTPKVQGLVEQGNIDLHNRPKVKNADGSISTVRSISIEEDGKEVLIPTVVGNRVVSNQEAIREYKRTGKHLGKFSSVEDADRYAEQLHNEQAAEYVH